MWGYFDGENNKNDSIPADCFFQKTLQCIGGEKSFTVSYLEVPTAKYKQVS